MLVNVNRLVQYYILKRVIEAKLTPKVAALAIFLNFYDDERMVNLQYIGRLLNVTHWTMHHYTYYPCTVTSSLQCEIPSKL